MRVCVSYTPGSEITSWALHFVILYPWRTFESLVNFIFSRVDSACREEDNVIM